MKYTNIQFKKWEHRHHFYFILRYIKELWVKGKTAPRNWISKEDHEGHRLLFFLECKYFNCWQADPTQIYHATSLKLLLNQVTSSIAKGTFHTKSFHVLDATLSNESLCKSKLSISKESKYTDPDRNLIANLLEASNICKLFTAAVDNVLSQTGRIFWLLKDI